MRRRKKDYFTKLKDGLNPVVVRIKRRTNFREVDIMAIVWYGRYASYFEEGFAALGKKCGLSYQDFSKNDLRSAIVQFHVDYHKPLIFDEEFTIETSLIWNEGARIDTEYAIIKADNTLAATGYIVQLFISPETNQPLLASPKMMQECRNRWRKGEFECLK